MNNFSEYVKTKREEAGISQDQLAEYLGVDKRTVQYWESGESEPRPKKKAEVEQFFKDYADPEKLLINTETFTETSLVANTKLLHAIFRETVKVRALLEGLDFQVLYQRTRAEYFGPAKGPQKHTSA